MGMAIIANKYPHVYAAVCENSFAAEKSRSIIAVFTKVDYRENISMFEVS